MISHRHQCIFVHIPKTAGNSVNRVFGVEWQDHKDLARYAAELPPEIFAAYFKFAIVRNPWDRLFSDYNYQLKKSRARSSKLFVFDERGRKRDFAAWVEAALHQPDLYAADRWGGEVSPHIHRWSPQLDWLSLRGEAAVDFVARMENLGEAFPAICRRVGLPVQRLPRRNRRFHLHYSHYYDRTTRDVVGAYYARDIAAFGYDFEERTLHLRLFLQPVALFQRSSPDAPVLHGGLLAALRLPAPAEAEASHRVTSYPGIARRRPPLPRRVATVASALLLSSLCWLGTGFGRHEELASARDASVPVPLARLLMPRPGPRADFPYRAGLVNSLASLLPPASAALWQVWPGVLPGDSFIDDLSPTRPAAMAAPPPPPPPLSTSAGSNPPPSRRWLLRNWHDSHW